MAQSINYPPVRTYFIAYTSYTIYNNGYVDPDQTMTTGQPNLYQTINEAEYLVELAKFHQP
jgi:hypothetical protein